MDLDEIAIKHQADKSSLYHNCAEKYDRILCQFRNSYMSVMEIGVGNGQSIRMWADYFPNATIHGVDIAPQSKSCETYSDRIKFHLADQGNDASLRSLHVFAPFDLIVDDGNHFWREQILSFNALFPFVRSGGIYIVEDTCTSYWSEYCNYPVSCVEHFKKMVDAVNLFGARGSIPHNPPPEFGNWDKGWHRREDCHVNVPEFESIQFMNSIIVVRKRS